MPAALPTPPSGAYVYSEAPTQITLAWLVAGTGDHYDIYRASASRSGFFGPFVKVNNFNPAIAVLGFTDGPGSLVPPAANQHYCYVVYAVNTDGSMIAANPVFATTYSNTDAVSALRDAIATRIASVLGSDWHEMPYTVTPEKNNVKDSEKAWGLIPDEGPIVGGPSRGYDVEQVFRIQLSRVITKNENSDAQVMAAAIDSAEKMEEISVDLLKVACGAPSICVKVDPLPKNRPEWIEQDRVVVLSASLKVRYRINL